MSRAAIYQLFRRIPDADDAAIDAAVDALAEQVATKADLAEMKAEMKADMVGLEARLCERLSTLEARLSTLEARLCALEARLSIILWALGLLSALNLAVLGSLLAQAVL